MVENRKKNKIIRFKRGGSYSYEKSSQNFKQSSNHLRQEATEEPDEEEEES